MTRFPSALRRFWRAQPWNPNPLMRGSDRCEGLLRLLAAAVILAAIPVAGAAGTADYSGSALHIQRENATKSSVTAALSADPSKITETDAAGQISYRYQAPVRWTANGRPGHATVDVPRDAARGHTISMWIGPDGAPTSEPTPPGAAAVRGVGTGLVVLTSAWLATAAVLSFAHWAFDLRNRARWAREWRTVSRPLGQDR
ncbi:hypothetical protein [Nocardia terpenica]|uniref:Uncharacterized protein n=1 Tax=Nocardia terpenica TaxID=455432 RepID=A0A164NT21_9NOCA|nr:hypothetical protein [Nocardia terpenica]KZM74692.1 hypothetical protein AWN90_21770 [Nocardia terpenica]NQE93697.1 hypothetical protein [Nocardia terpenica]